MSQTIIQQNTLIKQALEYAEKGWKVFPLHSIRSGKCSCYKPDACTCQGKHPRTLNGLKDATTDEQQIREWWSNWTDANIGIATGTPLDTGNNLIVVDVDVAKGGKVEDLGKIPETFTVKTGGGYHFYYSYPQIYGFRNTGDNELGNHIDTRAEGGYVVAPPSTNIKGPYELINDAAIAQIPFHLVKILLEAKNKKADRGRGTTQEDEDVSKESRNNYLTRRAGLLRETGSSVEEVRTMLLSLNQTRYGDGKHPSGPLTEEEIEGTIMKSVRGWEKGNMVEGKYKDGLRAVNQQQQVVDERPHYTDLYNADRLIERFGDILRHTPSGWFCYDGVHWAKGDKGVYRKAEETVKSFYKEVGEMVDSNDRSALVKHAIKSESHVEQTHMIQTAANREAVSCETSDFDTTDALYLINTPNGTIDLRTGELREHRATDMITKKIPASYIEVDRKRMESSRWVRFIDEITDGNKDIALYIQKALGYSLTGDQREQAFFFCYGAGNNGKSILLEVVCRVLGDYGHHLPMETLLTTASSSRASNEKAGLVGKRFVYASENDPDKEISSGMLKQLTSGEGMREHKLYEESSEFIPQCQLWVSTNHLPVISDMTPGMWRRVKAIPFTVDFTGREEKGLQGTLLAEQDIGMQWLIDGCHMWQADKLEEPEAVKAAVKAYRDDQDVLADFFSEKCVRGPEQTAKAGALYESYKTYQGFNAVSNRKFKDMMKERKFQQYRSNEGMVWKGISLITTTTQTRLDVGSVGNGGFSVGNDEF